MVQRRIEDAGTRLMLLRRETGMNQGELAAALRRRGIRRVTGSHISAIELNKKRPSLEVAVALADELNTSLDYLMARTDISEPATDMPERPMYMSPEADEIAAIIDRLPPFRRDELLRHAQMVEVIEAQNERDVKAALDAVALKLRSAGLVIGEDGLRQIRSVLLEYTAALLGTNTTATIDAVTTGETPTRRRSKATA